MIHYLILLGLLTLVNLICLAIIPIGIIIYNDLFYRLRYSLLVPPVSILIILGLVVLLFIDILYTNIKERLDGNK